MGVMLLSLMMSTSSGAQTEPSPRPIKSQVIPQEPSTPPELPPGTPPLAALSCGRKFIYQGKELDCDSIMHRDGEGLRAIISKNHQAVTELDLYQTNRKAIHNAAYVGTTGLVLALAGIFAKSRFDASMSTRNILVGSGILLAGGSLIYGLTVLGANERHLSNAVEYYNQGQPQDTIRMEFDTQLHF